MLPMLPSAQGQVWIQWGDPAHVGPKADITKVTVHLAPRDEAKLNAMGRHAQQKGRGKARGKKGMGKGKGKGKGKGSSQVAKGGKVRKVRRGAPAAMERGRGARSAAAVAGLLLLLPARAARLLSSVACVIIKIRPPRRI